MRENIRHWRLQSIIESHGLQVQNVFNRAQQVDFGVTCGDDFASLDVGPNGEGNGPVCVHMIGPILGVIFDHENQCVVFLFAGGDLLDEAP